MNKSRVLLLLFLVFIVFPSTSFAQVEEKAIVEARTELKIDMQPMADRIVWKYKWIGNKLYGRKFNRTKNRWEGDWILLKIKE